MLYFFLDAHVKKRMSNIKIIKLPLKEKDTDKSRLMYLYEIAEIDQLISASFSIRGST